MSMLRSARAFAAIRPTRLLRTYATEAAVPAGSSGKLTFSLALPHDVLVKNETVQQVNLSGSSGDMGVLADHVPTIEQLKPGVIEVIMTNNESKKWFLSGGFAIVNPDSSLNVNAVEAFKLDEISPELVREKTQEAERIISGSGSEEEKVAARVQLEVYEALQAAL